MAQSILIVDDNLDNIKLAGWLLEDQGYEIYTAENGQQALDFLSQQKVDLVLMDISMPVMDGKEATRRIRQDPELKDLIVVAHTAHAVKGEAEKIRESGVNDIITKPINETAFLDTINRLLIR